MKHRALLAVLSGSRTFRQAISRELNPNAPIAFVVTGDALPAEDCIAKDLVDTCIEIFNSKAKGVFVQTRAALPNESDNGKLMLCSFDEACFLAYL